ncbi:MAG: cell division protein FtsZ [Fibrobacter sp.]|nr:cell division protein FtsZ [Fibrobacter sp.]
MSTSENNIDIEVKPRQFIAENLNSKAKIKVVGIGGAGGNAVNRMHAMDIDGVDFIAINTDMLALENSLAAKKIPIGARQTKNLGAGGKPAQGRAAITDDKNEVEQELKDCDMVFITAGMGGGTGTGAAPVVAEITKKLGILTVAVVTLPFEYEGPVRARNAAKGVAELRQFVDSIIVIQNEKVMEIIEDSCTTEQAYVKIDEILGNAVKSVCSITHRHGTINLDFSDIHSVLKDGGDALMGTGFAEGEDRALKAAEYAIKAPLLEGVSIEGAKGVIVNISHGENFTMSEFNAAMKHIQNAAGPNEDLEVFFGDIVDPNLKERVSITVIATGFGSTPPKEEQIPVEMERELTKTDDRQQASPRSTTQFGNLARNLPTDSWDLNPPTGNHFLGKASMNENNNGVSQSSFFETEDLNVKNFESQEEIRNTKDTSYGDSFEDYNKSETLLQPAYKRGQAAFGSIASDKINQDLF